MLPHALPLYRNVGLQYAPRRSDSCLQEKERTRRSKREREREEEEKAMENG